MPEPLKNLYNQEMMDHLCGEITAVFPAFDTQGFNAEVFRNPWKERELKDRMGHIASTLRRFLPQDYRGALEILKPVSSKRTGFEYMFFPGFVEAFGLEDYEASIPALEHFTPFASSEFAVRPFIKRYGDRMMAQMAAWAESENHHVRRLASEGCRPRLPWAMALPEFKKDPTPVLEILHKLKDDPSEYVRRSVANNLNDISKDHPRRVWEIARQWLGASAERDWLVKHACRTLLKQGDPDTLVLFGFTSPDHVTVDQLMVQDSVAVGDDMEFSFRLSSSQGELGKLRLEYGIDFMKKNGEPSRKIFKISEAHYSDPEKQVTKRHSFRIITTRVYYAGAHGLAVLVNGREKASAQFELLWGGNPSGPPR